MLHELCHLIGLRKGSTMPDAHCPRESCTMHPSANTEAVLCWECVEELDDMVRRKNAETPAKLNKAF